MSWKPRSSQQALEARAYVNEEVRTFFRSRNVLEVETPILTTHAVTDQHIESISTEHSGFLHTSPEYAMKRLLSFYKTDIYQLCKVFRDNERGRHHHNEFTMLEWYRVAWSYKDLIQEVDSLVKSLLNRTHAELETKLISYQQIFKNM